jgi:hypothetical protein
MYDGKFARLGEYGWLDLQQGDKIQVKLTASKLIFLFSGKDVEFDRKPEWGDSLALQLFASGDSVKLHMDPVMYNHGINIDDESTCTAKAKHEVAPGKPTFAVFGKEMTVEVKNKKTEIRFGVMDIDRYSAAEPGTSWHRDFLRDVVTFLNFNDKYDHAALFNGDQKISNHHLDHGLCVGDIVSVSCSGGQVHFTVNGVHVVSAPSPGETLAVQFFSIDAVKLVSKDKAPASRGPPAPAPAPPPPPPQDDKLPKIVDAKLPDKVASAMPPDGFLLRNVERDEPAFGVISNMFFSQKPHELHKGRDVKGTFPHYDGIKVARIWQVQSWRNQQYTMARDFVKRRVMSRKDLVVDPVRTELDQFHSYACPDLVLDSSINEKLLFHGTKPDTVVPILTNGLNERFCGGLFGQGSYLAEEVEKIDQYVHIDDGFDPSSALHKYLYDDQSVIRHPTHCFYAFVCRAILGKCVHTQDGVTSCPPSVPGNTFIGGVTDPMQGRELSIIPGLDPGMGPLHYGTLLAEKGVRIARFREFIIFHSDKILPEFLVAFHRTNNGKVVWG